MKIAPGFQQLTVYEQQNILNKQCYVSFGVNLNCRIKAAWYTDVQI